MKLPFFRKKLAAAVSTSLRLRARELAHGWSSGHHRSARKGSGIEFAGHRAYTPGDDLRHLDHHALLKHGRLLIREFHTDTERAVQITCDLTASMYFGSHQEKESKSESKLERALLLAGALAFTAHNAGDALGLTLVTPQGSETLPPRRGNEWFERIISKLEALDVEARNEPRTPKAPQAQTQSSSTQWHQVFSQLGRVLPRGTVIFVLSDFLDLDSALMREMTRLSTKGRALRCVQILSHEEVSFPYEGALRLRDPETGAEIETDAAGVRGEYLNALEAQSAALAQELGSAGGTFSRHEVSEPAGELLRRLSSGAPR